MNDQTLQEQLTHLYNEQFITYRQLHTAKPSILNNPPNAYEDGTSPDNRGELEFEMLRIWEARNRLVVMQVEGDRRAAVEGVERMLNL